jgi:Ca2+-binding RTX toxin-like protein
MRILFASLVVVALTVPASNAIATTPTCLGKPATIVGTQGPDTLEGTPGSDVIVGLGGDDVIRGADGNDWLCGGPGGDKMGGGRGRDQVLGQSRRDNTMGGGPGNDVLRGGGSVSGGPGNDVVEGAPALGDLLEGGPGDDTIRGGCCYTIYGQCGDTISYQHAPGPVDVNLQEGRATGDGTDTIWNINCAIGSPYADHIVGSSEWEWLYGLGGDDVLDSLSNGYYYGVLDGGDGTDTCIGTDDERDNCEGLQ